MSTRFESFIDKADSRINAITDRLPQSEQAISRRKRALYGLGAVAFAGALVTGVASNIEHVDGQTIIQVGTNPKGNIAEVQEAISGMGIDLDTVGQVTQAGNLADQYADRQGGAKVTVYENFWGKRAEVSTPTLKDDE